MIQLKYLFTCTTFLIYMFSAIGQNKIVKSLDSLQENTAKYLNAMEYAFMMHEETPWMFKGGYNSNTGFLLGFERRIIGGLTANISLEENSFLFNYSSLGLSTRYYYNMKSRHKDKKTPLNLSGNYFAVGLQFNFRNRTLNEAETSQSLYIEEVDPFQTYYIKWGMQRRYLKRGFVDIGLKLAQNNFNRNTTEYRMFSESSFGIVFAKDKIDLNKNKLCSVIKCQEADRSVFKGDISNLLNIRLSTGLQHFGIQPEIAYERKIGKSAFSINNTVNLTLGLFHFTASDFKSFNLSFEHTLETRYYYNLKKRILKGKTGNGLSANYVSIGIFNNYRESLTSSFKSEHYGYLQPQISSGIQRFVGDHFFYDIGLGVRKRKRNLYTNQIMNNQYEIFLTNKVGFRF